MPLLLLTNVYWEKKTFHRIWWIFSLVHVKLKMKVERSRSFKILALPQFSEQKEFKILESFKNRQNFNSMFFHSTGADLRKEIRSIAKFQFVLRGHTVMITKKAFQNQTKIVRALQRSNSKFKNHLLIYSTTMNDHKEWKFKKQWGVLF